MSQSLERLRLAIAASDTVAAVEAGHEVDVELVVNPANAEAVFLELLAMLKALPQPQSPVGQRIVNIFQSHWDRVPAGVLADARAFCEGASAEFVDAGAYQAMIELASGEWPGHVRASDV
jgi:hypothetical protein